MEGIVVKEGLECKSKVVAWDIDDPYFMPHRDAEEILNHARQRVKEPTNSFELNQEISLSHQLVQ